MNDPFFTIDEQLRRSADDALSEVSPAFQRIAEITSYNQQKVLSAFIRHRVSEMHLGTSTGYGYDDPGRQTLEAVWADCMGAQDALIRHQFSSGTHTLAVALFGVLRPKDTMLCLTGRPYDTLIDVLGIDQPVSGSLADFGIEYDQVDLCSDGTPDLPAIRQKLQSHFYGLYPAFPGVQPPPQSDG